MVSNRRLVTLPSALIAAVSVAVAAAPAQAQWTGRAAKTDAILGGSPSRLAAIMSAQASESAPRPMLAAAAAPGTFLNAPLASPRIVAEPVSFDRPDVFNSVALEVGQTPLDHRWNRVARSAVTGSAAAFAAALSASAQRDRIEAVNAYVNRRVSFVDDIRRFGQADRWSAAAETLASGRGDCEDYALAKMALLRRAGVADRDLYLVVLKDLVRRADHAVLVVRSNGRFLVLDNGTDLILDSAEVRDYRPILTFTAGRTFTHGYRRVDTPSVSYARAETPAAPISTAAGPAFAALSSTLPMSMFAVGARR